MRTFLKSKRRKWMPYSLKVGSIVISFAILTSSPTPVLAYEECKNKDQFVKRTARITNINFYISKIFLKKLRSVVSFYIDNVILGKPLSYFSTFIALRVGLVGGDPILIIGAIGYFF